MMLDKVALSLTRVLRLTEIPSATEHILYCALFSLILLFVQPYLIYSTDSSPMYTAYTRQYGLYNWCNGCVTGV